MSRKVSTEAIGVFDSGVGGLTVLRALKELLPQESFIYFGDTARVPYGTKGADTIIRYASESAMFLLEQKIKMLVIACNTVSAYALESLQKKMNIPVIGVIEPGVDSILAASKTKKIAVLGTTATIKSGAYEKQIKAICPEASVYSLPCPLFVPLVEEKMGQHRLARSVVEEYLIALKNTNIDAVLLGCTHYPLLRSAIEEVLNKVFSHSVTIVDSANTCATYVRRLLEKNELILPKPSNPSAYFVSDDPEKFKEMANLFLQNSLDQVELVQHKENTFFKII